VTVAVLAKVVVLADTVVDCCTVPFSCSFSAAWHNHQPNHTHDHTASPADHYFSQPQISK